MSVLAVAAAVAAAVLLVASVRAFLIGGLQHRLPSMPASSGEHDLRERSLPRRIWIMGGCLVVMPAVALPFPIPLLVLVACLVGFRLRHLPAQRRDRRRACAVDAEIPQLLDLLAAGSSAGLAAPLALRRAADGLRGPLSDEVRRTAEAVELGARWRVELHAMSDRLDLPDLRRTVSVLTRTETLGSSLEAATAELATTVRQVRRAAITERARAAPVKMLFPLVFLVLPAFLLLTVVPVLLTTVQSIR
ncbi:MAG: type II secretion system F family protein [Actinomycetota bacterium]